MEGYFNVLRAARTIAIRAGRLFDSKAGRMLTKQVVILSGERITDVGPAISSEDSRPERKTIDLSQATVLPGLIDAHTHMFNNRADRMEPRKASMLIAVQNAAGGPAGGLHRRARHEHARQRIRGRGDPRRDQPGAHRRAAVSGVDAGHRMGSYASEPVRLRTIRWRAPWFARWRRRARPCGIRSATARTGSSCFRQGAYSFTATGVG
jgi:predicted amidohydrolase YtcJ